jgi:hypothetical protein
MKPNLDILKPEIELYLEETGLAVFYGYSRPLESAPAVYWDCDQYPDYRLFVQSARAAGAKLIVFISASFSPSRLMRPSKSCTLANCLLRTRATSKSG